MFELRDLWKLFMEIMEIMEKDWKIDEKGRRAMISWNVGVYHAEYAFIEEWSL